MSNQVNYDEVRQNIKNGAIYPELVALGHVIRYFDSQKGVSADKMISDFKPLLRKQDNAGIEQPKTN